VCAGKFKLSYEKFRADERIFLDFHWHLCIGENRKTWYKRILIATALELDAAILPHMYVQSEL
jgi:hypothetical protein